MADGRTVLSQQLEDLSLEDCFLPEKPAPGTRAVQKYNVTTNLFPVHLSKGIRLYKYNVQVDLQLGNSQRTKEISKGGAADDYHKTQNRRRCFEAVWKTLVHSEKEFFGDNPFAVLYNRWNALYSLKQLDVQPTKSFRVNFVDPESQTHQECSVKLEIGDPERVDLGDFSNEISQNLVDRANCPTTKAVEDLISQPIFLKEEYFSFYRNFYKMPPNPVDLGSGRELAEGFSASEKVVQGLNGGPHFATQIDLKHTAFHKEQPMTEAMLEILGLGQVPPRLTPRQRIDLNKALRDVAVRTTHTNRDFKVAGISHETARSYKIPSPGVQTSVEEYFQQRYSLTLQYPELPCVKQLASRPGDTVAVFNYYPVEVCSVLPNQRVAVKKQTEQQQQIMIKEAAKAPATRLQEIKKIAAMVSENKSLDAVGGEMDKNSMVVPARKLPLPEIGYERKGSQPNTARPRVQGNWDQGNRPYLERGSSNLLAVLKLDKGISMQDANEFANKWEQECRKSGITIARLLGVFEADEDGIDFNFKEFQRENVDFVIAIEPKGTTIHNKVKLAEFVYGIQTQCVATENAKSIVRPPRDRQSRFAAVLKNFVQKSNMKTRGFNYEVLTERPEIQKWLKPGVMIIGCDVTHPASVSSADLRRGIEPREPSVVGFTFNLSDNPQQFLGEIRFQGGGNEINITEMDLLMEMALGRYAKKQRALLPQSIIYYRDGVANSQFQKVLQFEVAKMRQACSKIYKDMDLPKFTVQTVQKRNQVRLFPENINPKDRSADQNVPVGTVASVGLTHPTTFEYHLNAHRAFQGTVSTPKYVVLLNENNMSPDELEGLTYALCYGHQIINQPTSLPEPVYAAHEIAKRGKNLWRASCAGDESSSGVSGGDTGEKIDWSEWNEKFQMGKSVFRFHKHNA